MPSPRAFAKASSAVSGLLAPFIKTPTVHAIEIIGSLSFDFVVIDAEHAPFDRFSIDMALLAARGSGGARPHSQPQL